MYVIVKYMPILSRDELLQILVNLCIAPGFPLLYSGFRWNLFFLFYHKILLGSFIYLVSLRYKFCFKRNLNLT